jgi:hypothetical protein
MCLRDILHRPRGIILIKSTKIRWFMRRSGGGGLALLSEAKSLKTTQVRSSGSSLLRLDGSHNGHEWAGPVTWWPFKGCILSSQSQEELSGSSPLRSVGSRDSQTGG